MNYFFRICVWFLDLLSNIFHITYQQISVYINLYLQGGALVISTIPVLVIAVVHRNLFGIVISTLNVLLYVLGVAWMMVHYRLPRNIVFAFNQCVNDLLYLAKEWHISYQQVNIVIFVLIFLVLIMLNIGLCFLI